MKYIKVELKDGNKGINTVIVPALPLKHGYEDIYGQRDQLNSLGFNKVLWFKTIK